MEEHELAEDGSKKKADSVHIVTNQVVQTPDVLIEEGPSYFNYSRLEASAVRPERRPQLEYHASEIELEMLDHIPRDFHDVLSHGDRNTSIDRYQTKLAGPLMMSFTNRKNVWRLFASCFWAFGQGFADGAPGALLPYMEEYYHITYSIVSMIWICNAVGVISFAFIAHKILVKLGVRYSLVAACGAAVVMHSIISTGTKFPVICLAYFIGGIGLSIAGSQLNIFVSRYEKASLALGYFHGCYGLGASVSPLLATVFVSQGYSWHTFYFILLGLMVFALINIYFHFIGADDEMKAMEASEAEDSLAQLNMLIEAMKSKTTWLISFFVLFYQGAEVSVGAWIVTYIRDFRNNHSTSVGYVASGYWFGLTFGRLIVTPTFHHYLGPRQGNIILIALSLLLIGLTWAVTSTVGEGICVSLAGVAIGPIYPLMISLVSHVIPRKIQVVSLVFASAFGYSGGALFPFLIGLISQYCGAYVMLPAFLALFSSTLAIWLCLPKIQDGKGFRSGMRRKLATMHKFFA